MGATIRAQAAVPAILRDVRKTADNATARGEPFAEDAARFLDPVLQMDEELAAALAEAKQILSQARSARDAQDQACNDLVAKAKDHECLAHHEAERCGPQEGGYVGGPVAGCAAA